MRNVVLLPRAKKEFLEAVSFYAQEFPEVGRAFSEEFFQSIEFINTSPKLRKKSDHTPENAFLKDSPISYSTLSIRIKSLLPLWLTSTAIPIHT